MNTNVNLLALIGVMALLGTGFLLVLAAPEPAPST